MSNMDNELAKQFENWNPMRDAYKDSRFNTYSSGPGADLEDSLQPAELAKQLTNNQRVKDPFLVFKFVPNTLTLDGLINICSAHGKCLRGRKFGMNMYFIDFASINDMERVFTRLETNTYGFRVELAKSKEPKQKQPDDIASTSSHDTRAISSNKINDERAYQISSKNPRRPHFPKEPLVKKSDYINPNNYLSQTDPQMHFLIENDAHALERVPYAKQEQETEDGKYKYHTGRAYYTMPQKGSEFIKEKQKTVAGSYDMNKTHSKQIPTNYTQESFVKPSPPDIEKAKIGSCEHCKADCDTICSRCSAYFCSVNCQTEEWKRHRYICGKPSSMWPTWAKHIDELKNGTDKTAPLPEEQKSPSAPIQNDSTQKAALEAKLPPSGANVMITAISKTNVVFVRSTLYEDNLKFFTTVSIIQKKAQQQSPVYHTPRPGEIVITKYKNDQYNRAMVLQQEDLDNIKLLYVDYGNIDSKSLDELLVAPDEFWKLPRMAVPIILKDVPEFFMTDEVKKYMFSFLNKEVKIVYNEDTIQNKVNTAELFDLSNNESFNKTIASFRAGLSNEKKAPVLYREFLEYSPFPVGENVELIVLDNSLLQTGFISCTTKAYVQEIQKFQDDIQVYAKANLSTKTYTPRVNELCIAKYDEDDLWYRGRCIEVVGDGHPSILFIDYGNITTVNVKNILKYPQEFTFPIMTCDCEINGLPADISDDLKSKLEKHLEPGTKIVCDMVEFFKEDNFYSIHLKNLLEKVLS